MHAAWAEVARLRRRGEYILKACCFSNFGTLRNDINEDIELWSFNIGAGTIRSSLNKLSQSEAFCWDILNCRVL